MVNSKFLCLSMKNILKIALNEHTPLRSAKSLVYASKIFANAYFDELESTYSKGNVRAKINGLEFFILDLIVNFKERDVSFPASALIKLLKSDQDIFFFTSRLIQGETPFTSLWIETSKEKREEIMKAHKVVRAFIEDRIENVFNPLYVYAPKNIHKNY